MLRAILLADKNHRNYHSEDFFRVYSDSVLDELNSLVEVESEPLFLHEFEEKKQILQETEIILSNWGMPELKQETVRVFLPRVKAVFYAGGDVRPFAAPFFQQNVRIFSTGHANAVPASEYALAQILLASKGVQRNVRLYRGPESYQMARRRSMELQGNYHLNVGILGVGRVGSRLAELLKPFSMKVYGCDPFLTPQRARELHLELTDQETLFSLCDVVSCHLPEWSTLRKTLGEELFLSMPKNGVFINSAQASVVDQD